MTLIYILLFTTAFFITVNGSQKSKIKAFPKNFSFGASSSAYQMEGAVNEDGKGENIWDRFIHSNPDRIKNKDNADVACDSYHKYKEDVQMLKEVGFNHYRFSISWSRVLPNGHENYINKKGLQYYHNLIDELLENGIEPFVTIYHWDLPQPLQDLGGWANPVMAEFFERFAFTLFQEFGHKVKWWATINEPLQISFFGYGRSVFAPGVNQTGIADFMATRTLLLAHARVYHLYKKHFAPTQKGKVGISIHCINFEPKTNSAADVEAANTASQFMTGIFAHPIFSKKGDYAELVKQVVGRNSEKEGWYSSRLPELSAHEIKLIKGSADFFGLNHYTSMMVATCSGSHCPATIYDNTDMSVAVSANPKWPTSASSWLQSAPSGVRSILNWIKNQYGNPPVVITEAGWSTDGTHPHINDTSRIQYFQGYLEHVLDAMFEDNCNVLGFTAWALMDNFEWISGYTERFGLYYVDFNDPNRTRTKRNSADFMRNVITTRQVSKNET